MFLLLFLTDRPLLSEALSKFRSGTTPQEKEDAYKTVYLLLAAGLAIPGVKGFKVGPPIDKKGTRGYEFGRVQDLFRANTALSSLYYA
jgi:hypothetical protein